MKRLSSSLVFGLRSHVLARSFISFAFSDSLISFLLCLLLLMLVPHHAHHVSLSSFFLWLSISLINNLIEFLIIHISLVSDLFLQFSNIFKILSFFLVLFLLLVSLYCLMEFLILKSL